MNLENFIESMGDEDPSILCSKIKNFIKQSIRKQPNKTFSSRELSTVVIPDNTRKIYSCNNSHLVLVEHDPMVRTISIDLGYHKNTIKSGRLDYDDSTNIVNLRLSFPYIRYLVRTGENDNSYELYVGFSDKPYDGNNRMLFPLLPNVRDNGSVCIHSYIQPTNLRDFVNNVISAFWESTFRYGLCSYNQPIKGINSYLEWQDKSKENPLFVLKVPFPNVLNWDSIIDDFIVANSYSETKSNIYDFIDHL